MVIWLIFSSFGMLYQEKSDNPPRTLLDKNQDENRSTFQRKEIADESSSEC
jgi:hypothetical protein